jgi:tetratricopeptide (TPR) repeat protein
MNRVYCCEEHQKLDWNTHKPSCKYNPGSCEVCGKREGLQSCAGCLHRKCCCEEHQKKAWKDHKTICNVYKKLKLANHTDPKETAKVLFKHFGDLLYGRVRVRKLALRVIIEVLSLATNFGLHDEHHACLWQMAVTLHRLKKIEEAEIFARDAIDFSRDKLNNLQQEFSSAGILAGVLLDASKSKEAIEVCDHYLEICSAEDSMSKNTLSAFKSQALSDLGRDDEALAELAFVRTSNCAEASNWKQLSEAQQKLGR